VTTPPSGRGSPTVSDGSGTIGYAVVGLGWISQAAVLPAFTNARGNSRLTALVSGDAGKRRALADRYDLPESATFDYDDYEACLARDDVQAVYIALPNHLHRDYTVRAAERGVHVLCEKPLAVTEAECRAMIEACRAHDVRLMTAYRLHLDPANLHAVRLVEEGAIGQTRVFSSTFTQHVQEGDVRLVSPRQGGGPLYDIGIYCINAARYLFRAEPEAVWMTQVSRNEARFQEGGEAVSCVLRFPNHRLATVTCSFGAHAASVFHLVGDDGEITMDNPFPFQGPRQLTLRTADGEDRRAFPETDQFGAQLLYFSDCILQGREPQPDGHEGLVDVRIMSAAYESLDTGRMIPVDIGAHHRPTPDQALECPAVEEPDLFRASAPGDD
jgi:predicted dehydrogenase